ncbi:LOW QUALITY PROTEIN: inactive serine/threonine-protein kinase PLK5 [Loxodonta africana]|uniref:LOW QUALITY PROTEIN: inactive serine/threonine-protein kinase PLK5 n=1 Tax=Loxodonta africana TaxID=9785 RepID=UPI0030D46E62
MEPGLRRRRRSRQLVASFLRDPGSGRVYRRGKLIGKGAFSRCYKLTDMSTSAVFALKVVPRGGGGAGRLPPGGKVEREIALHSHLRHRNIVAFHGHFADCDHVYMVLEYCSRQSLAHVLKARQTLTEPEVRYYLRGLVSGLHYLHQRRIVHRDLKLSNFFLNKNMEVKIGDLGLAAKVGPGGRCHRVLCGTPNFLAPEVVSRNGHSCQSDIWALGCIMYMVLTGSPPFTAAPLSEMYQNIREGRYPEPTHLSPDARSLIARLLAPNPAERPSLDQVLQDDFFTQGFTPDRLPPHSCHSTPIFAIPQPLGRLFRKVGQLLLTQCRPPCPFTPKETPGPGEEGPEPDSMDWSSEASLSERGAPCPEVPICLLTQGTLRSDPEGSEGSWRPEVEAAIQGLLLCLDAAPPATQDPPGEQRPLLWAPKWVEYSSKYGFGYQLSDGGWGPAPRRHPHGPAPPRGDGALPGPTPPAGPSLCLLSFLVFGQASMLLFSNGTVQVCCSGEQARLVLSGEGENLVLTLLEQGRPGTSYPLGILRSHGCAPATRQRLHHALRMLQSI